MRIKTLLSATAIAATMSMGTAFAAEQFSVMKDVNAAPMKAAEMDAVQGKVVVTIVVNKNGVKCAGCNALGKSDFKGIIVVLKGEKNFKTF